MRRDLRDLSDLLDSELRNVFPNLDYRDVDTPRDFPRGCDMHLGGKSRRQCNGSVTSTGETHVPRTYVSYITYVWFRQAPRRDIGADDLRQSELFLEQGVADKGHDVENRVSYDQRHYAPSSMEPPSEDDTHCRIP